MVASPPPSSPPSSVACAFACTTAPLQFLHLMQSCNMCHCMRVLVQLTPFPCSRIRAQLPLLAALVGARSVCSAAVSTFLWCSLSPTVLPSTINAWLRSTEICCDATCAVARVALLCKLVADPAVIQTRRPIMAIIATSSMVDGPRRVSDMAVKVESSLENQCVRVTGSSKACASRRRRQ